MMNATPSSTNSIASVAMSGLMRKRVTMNPFTHPMATPTTTPITNASTSGTPDWNSFPAVTPTTAIPEPMERSSPPPISTSVKPVATMKVTALNRRIVRTFWLVRKKSSRDVK